MKLSFAWSVRLGAAALVLATAPSGYSEVKDNPYQIIIERNVFDVHPPPPPSNEPPTPPPPPPPKTVVKLTGITTLGGTAKALVEITPEPGKPADKQILKVGEGSSGIELLDIDVTNTTIKVRLGAAEFLVGFTNAPTAGGAPNPALATRPGMPAIPLPTQPGVIPGMPNTVPGAIPQPTAAYNPAGATSLGSRGGITVGGAEVSGANGLPAPGMNAMNPNYRAIPSRTVRTDGTAATTTAPAMTRAEAEVHMELLRTIQQQNAQQGRLSGPPLPPTTLTPLLQGNGN